ncbi:MotA/TolQ/ExbB proton channel family protein [Methanobacterium oryzae]|uniref:MotA/TolQ/ExbB proton channel family protein n=1 Tax=Methanobacterium oryzae TaxID=69540 RepID=UPI003D1B0631
MIYEFLSSTLGTILEMFKSGGVITYIIAIIGIYGLILSLEKIFYLRKISKVSPPLIMGTVNDAMERGGSLEALRSISKYRNPVSRIISEALKIGYRNKTEVEDAMERVFIVEMGRMTKSLGTIKMIIEVAPLLGLIGTVLGMWYTFRALGVNASPTAMAEGIYIALITTIAGLTVAIVLLPLHSNITARIENEMDKIEITKKMTNWKTAVMRIKVEMDTKGAIEALRDSEGIVKVKEIDDANANILVALKPSMLEKSIPNILMEKCNVKAEIVESKLMQ